MSITITNNLSKINTAYNPIYIRPASTNTANYGFKFVFDLYVSGVFVNRVKLLPRPLSTNTLYSPARVLETYVTYDLTNQIITSGLTTNSFKQYEVKIGEEYGSALTGTTVYSGLTTVSGYTFNGVLQYDEIPTWDYLDYIAASGGTSSFLTNSPASKLIKVTERETMAIIFSGITAAVLDAFITVTAYKLAGGVTTQQESIYSTVSGLTGPLIIGTGPWNVNQWLLTDIDPAIHYKYTVNIGFTDVSTDYIVSEIKTYILDSQCGKYDSTRFMFLNSLGQFDYFTAKLFNKKSIDINRTTYKKNLAYNYVVGDRGTTVINVKASESHTVTSDWIDTDTSQWLTELFLSPEVYILDEAGVIIPVIIDNNSIDVKRTDNEKLINYTFNYSMANEINTARG